MRPKTTPPKNHQQELDLGTSKIRPPVGISIQSLHSGGQTGADRAALDLAIRYGFPYGGWCPKGRLAEDGPLGGQYRLRESPSTSYLQRTEWNVRDTDGTVIFCRAPRLTGGSLRTQDFARKHRKPSIHIGASYTPELDLIRFIEENQIQTLNVAGSRESKDPGIYGWVYSILEQVIFAPQVGGPRLGGPGEG